MKKNIRMMACVVLLLLVAVPVLAADDTTTQTVTFQVSAINEISVSGNPALMDVNAATAGSAPNEVTNAATTYAVTTNEDDRKITAAIDSNMPAGVTLKVNMVAPTGGTSANDVTLSDSAQDAVTGISTLAESGKTITYRLSATPAAGVVGSATRTVTFTLTAGS